ncbi:MULTISPECIES: hypothetical protein [Yersinia]|uniref:Uncharacterized protein n=1 Tax=Yersinia pekkanenii TaxID=1288385 RepID=A0A0T9RLW2_9GAMM|nr:MULTISPECIES: hypothetical protein [Yersinia]AYX15454.1 hypothetical protein EGX44_09765 [Yersinia pseudotuberculosis]CNI70962.1 Uncharacterised protein [Yersinia pekkanenii]CRY69735.1 Uncharacterised protein [Yersinia pekkanenii]
MDSEQEFFEQQRPEVAQVIGTAVMQLLTESGEVSKDSIAEMIEVLYQEEQVTLAVELAIDILRLPPEG